MELLSELVNTVARNKIRSINVIGDESFKKETHLNQLYYGILDGRITSEEEALELIGLKRKTKRFQNLKSELKRRLINTLFFVDVSKPGFTDLSQAYYTCCRRWAAVKVLIGRGAIRSGVSMAKKLYATCLKFEFTEIAMDMCRTLSAQYGYNFGDRNEFERYNSEYDELADRFQAENYLERQFSRLALAYLHNEGREVFETPGAKLMEEISPLLSRYDSYRVHLCGRCALIWNALNNFDYRETIEQCSSGIQFFQAKPYLANTPLGMFLHYKMLCHNQLKEFEAGRETAELAKQYYEVGTQNYFKFQESLLLLEMHTRHYEQAYHIYQHVTSLKQFKRLQPRNKEAWLLYGAYLEYLLTVKVFERPLGAKDSKAFRLNRFLNEVPIFNGEKRRRNIPVLILQVLFLIHRDRYSAAADRIEAVEKYCSRYLKKDASFRSNCFIKMLLQIPQTAFHVEAVKRKAEKHFKKLHAHPLEMTSQSWEVEIIPYEQLWEFALASLSNRRVSFRSGDFK